MKNVTLIVKCSKAKTQATNIITISFMDGTIPRRAGASTAGVIRAEAITAAYIAWVCEFQYADLVQPKNKGCEWNAKHKEGNCPVPPIWQNIIEIGKTMQYSAYTKTDIQGLKYAHS